MQQSPRARKLSRSIRTLSLFKVPLLGICRPKVMELSESRGIIQLPFEFLTKNHVGSMYFGALAMGAELSIALPLLARMFEDRAPITFIFKDFQAEFLKRAEDTVHFISEDVAQVNAVVDRALQSGERENGTFRGYAVAASNPVEKLVEYRLTISVKRLKGK